MVLTRSIIFLTKSWYSTCTLIPGGYSLACICVALQEAVCATPNGMFFSHFGHKKCIEFGKRAAHSHPIFSGSTLPRDFNMSTHILFTGYNVCTLWQVLINIACKQAPVFEFGTQVLLSSFSLWCQHMQLFTLACERAYVTNNVGAYRLQLQTQERACKASPNTDLIWILLFSCTLGNLYFLEERKLKYCKRYVAVISISSQSACLQAITCCSGLLTPVM